MNSHLNAKGYSTFSRSRPLDTNLAAKGQMTTMTYDLLGRMISRTELEGTSNWYYDSDQNGQPCHTGSLCEERSPGGSKSYSYSAAGRPLSVTTNTGVYGSFTINMSYDALGRIDTKTYPFSGQNGAERLVVKHHYTASGHLQSITRDAANTLPVALNAANATNTIWQTDAMDEFGHITSESFGNGISTTHSYDNIRGVLTGIVSTSVTNGDIQNWAYDYGVLGNMKFRHDIRMGYKEQFILADGTDGYDALNRITQSWDAAGTPLKSYTYDAIGNIQSKTGVGNYLYQDPLHPHAVTNAGGKFYSYDLNGNMTVSTDRTVQWTSFNKPGRVDMINTLDFASFTYDANHERLSKTTLSSTTVYIGKLFERQLMNAGGNKDVHYIYAGGKVVAQIESVTGLAPTIRYMHADNLGSINVITDAAGIEVGRYSYGVFGEPRNANGTDAVAPITSQSSRGYTGHEMDALLGLINMNARLYDPVLGRFLSADTIVPDPMNMQGYNRYAYVINNPLKYVDPSGHGWWSKFKRTVVRNRTFQKVVGATIAAAGVVYGAITQDWVTASYVVSFGAGYYESGTIGVTGSASYGSSPGGGTSITYASTLGSGNYSSSGGWSYTGYSGNGSL